MKKFMLTVAVVATLGLGACSSHNGTHFVPVDLGRTAGSDGAIQNEIIRVAPVRTTVRADRTYNRTLTK